MVKTVSRLNVFVDETGEFGFDKGASDLYGISFVFHEQKKDITYELSILNRRLSEIGYTDMIHTSSLAMGRDEYFSFGIKKEKIYFLFYIIFREKFPLNIIRYLLIRNILIIVVFYEIRLLMKLVK